MRRTILAGLLTLGLFGCADFAANVALKDAQSRCAREGKQFVQERAEKTELIVVSGARISGHCAGRGDPGYPVPK
jgi:hypothetical protein